MTIQKLITRDLLKTKQHKEIAHLLGDPTKLIKNSKVRVKQQIISNRN